MNENIHDGNYENNDGNENENQNEYEEEGEGEEQINEEFIEDNENEDNK